VTPVVGGWVGQRPQKDQGQIYGVFELPSPRNAKKRDKQNRQKISFGFWVDLFVKAFRHDVFAKRFL
jgi:hypothetical protein